MGKGIDLLTLSATHGVTENVDTWKIRVAGYGTFAFIGTEERAESVRRAKAQWERGMAIKWRVTNQRQSDALIEKLAGLWDRELGAPKSLIRQIAAARAREASGHG